MLPLLAVPGYYHCEIAMPSDLQSPELEVYLPGLREVPDMFDRQADDSRRCHDYAEDAYGLMDYGPGPLRNATVGIINYLSGAHNRIRGEVTDYFDEVRVFAAGQRDNVQEAVDLYETTDMEIAAMLDSSLFLPDRRQDVRELGRTAELDRTREMVTSPEPKEPVDALKPLTDHHSDFPFQPEWTGTGVARDTIWQVTHIAHTLGLMSRPVDIIGDLIDPFTGDWAGLKTCGEALANLANAASALHTNVAWTDLRIDAVWKGNAADACWLNTRVLEQSLSQAPRVLEDYAAAYEDVVVRVRELENRAGEVLAEALDWGIAALFGQAGLIGKAMGFVLPPANLIEAVRLVYELLDLVQLASVAVWDFNARVELGVLYGPGAGASLPAVPEPPREYY